MKHLRGLCFVPLGREQSRDHQFALPVGQARARFQELPQMRWQVLGTDFGWKLHQKQPFDEILELAHISRPVVVQKNRNKLVRKLMNLSRELLRELPPELPHQERDLLLPLPQPRQMHTRNIQTIKEVPAE